MSLLLKYGATDRFLNEATMHEGILARVISQHRGGYRAVTAQSEIQAEVSGKMRHETVFAEHFPTVGDYVMVSVESGGEIGIIQSVLTRRSIFLRKAVGTSGQTQAVAANIDTVFICMSLNNNYNLSRLERYLSVAWDSGATPVVVLTKADLCENLPEMVAKAEEVSSFSDVIAISITDADIEEKFGKYLKSGTTSTFIGSSGVGKSTLVNRLLGQAVLETAEIGKGDKGRHTTTGREMFPSPFGGVLIDTPGMRELGAESVDLSMTFDDIEALAETCKFADCTHGSEPGCAIRAALEEGTLDRRRFDNYLKLKAEVGYEGLTSRQIEEKKFERFGGVKNLRKIGEGYRKLKKGSKG